MGQKTFGFAVFAALILACLIPMSATAHPVNTVEGHIAEDSVQVTPAMEEWFGERTEAATEADAAAAAAAVIGDEGEVGQWGPVIDWPVVGIHMALLQNGKVLAYDSSADATRRRGPQLHPGHRLGSHERLARGRDADGLQHLLQRPRPI